jgi:multicomponent Na+:H+ antiporter subunit B
MTGGARGGDAGNDGTRNGNARNDDNKNHDNKNGGARHGDARNDRALDDPGRGPRDLPDAFEDEPRRHLAAGLVLTGGVAAALVAAVLTLPRAGNPLPAIARRAMVVALPEWRTTEPVSEVVYGTRGFDTFGETFLLLAAVVGIGLITRAREPRWGFIGEQVAGLREQRRTDPALVPGSAGQRQAQQAEAGEEGRRSGPVSPDDEPLGAPGPERAEAMTVVVRAAVRTVAPLLTMAGLYLVAWGYTPGGGFPGGAVALGVVLLVYVSLGYRRVEPWLRPGVIEPVELAGALAIVLLGVLGLLRGSISANFLPLGPVQTIRSGGVMQAFSVIEFVEVATGLVLAVFGMLGMRHDWEPEEAGDRPASRSGRDRR